MCLWSQGREERGAGGEERWRSRGEEEMKEKNHIQTHLQDDANENENHGQVSLKTWVESLSWTPTKALARDYDLY